MKWLYERGFGQRSAMVAVLDDGKKVGQITLLHQNIYLDGKPTAATQLVDLFILQAYRSPDWSAASTRKSSGCATPKYPPGSRAAERQLGAAQ